MTTRMTLRAFAGVLIPMLLGLFLIRTRAASPDPENFSFSDESPNIDSLAARIAEKLVKTGNKLVAVGHVHGDKTTDTRAYGLKLSEQLSVALASSNAGIQVFDNARLIHALEEKKWMAIDLDDPLVFRSIANAEGVRVAIGGHYKTSGQTIEISLTLTNTADDKKIAEIKAKLPATEATGSLPDTPVRDPVTQVYLPGVGGVTSPQCKYCPQPDFSPEARSKGVSYVKSVFHVTVRANGRVADIRRVRSAGYGLEENATHVLQTWQLVPCHLPDGTAVPARVDVEFNFRDH
jgi:Gram-negative bacterial TonB protein C-terminal